MATKLGSDSDGHKVQIIYQGAPQNVAVSATHAENSPAFDTTTKIVRLVSTTNCWILFSKAGTAAATSNGSYLPAGVVEYWALVTGYTLSVIRATADGTLNITEAGTL